MQKEIKKQLVVVYKMSTYARVRLGHSLEEGNMPSVDSWGSNFLLILIEPKILGLIVSHILSLPVQVIVVHL